MSYFSKAANSPVVGFTRGWERGTSLNGHKTQRFPILSANPTCVSSLEISTRTISRQNRNLSKKFVSFRKEKKLNGGVAILLKKSLLVNLITFLAYYSTCSRSANIVF